MKTSINIGELYPRFCGMEKAVEMVAKAGFDAWDYSMFEMIRYDYVNRRTHFCPNPLNGNDYIAFSRQLRRIGEDNGIVCNQSHAPFPVHIKEIFDYLKRAIECTAEAGGEICVIHPANDWSAEQNAEMYLGLLPFAKAHNVKIATENMWNWNGVENHAAPAACSSHQDFLKHMEAVNDGYFVACLDIGHAEMKGLSTSAVEMIKTLGKHIKALHIHDNDKIHDDHQIPRSMEIDFPPIIKALKEVGYDGYFTLEASTYLHKFTLDNVSDGLKDLYLCIRSLADEFERA